jgi:hypothetical protein
MAGPGGHDLGIVRAGEMQELVDLMRGDIGQDAAEPGLVEEPAGPDRAVEPMRPESDRLHDAPDRSVRDQFAGDDGRGNDEALGEADREDAAGLRHAASTSASCASVVTPGLSTMTSLPARIARIASAARSSGMPAQTISSIEGIVEQFLRGARRESGKALAEA